MVHGTYTVSYTDCYGCTGSDTYTIGVSVIPGCTDPLAFNYDPLANFDDGSCIAVVIGCTDSTALNYNSAVLILMMVLVYLVTVYMLHRSQKHLMMLPTL